jgi:hypothetical protein
MTITQVMFADLAAKQFAAKFNEINGTAIQVSNTIKEGTPFVTIDFLDTPKELIFTFAFELGKIQKRLERDGSLMLPVSQYPLPPQGE